MTRRGRIITAIAAGFGMLLGSPTPARADPVTTAIVGFIGFTGTAAAVASFVINTAFTFAANWAAGKLRGKAKASVQERQASVTTLSLGEVPRELLIGEACTAGSLIDAFNHGGKYGTDYVTRCIALADHVVEGLVGYFIDDKYYAFTANGVQPGFSGSLDIEFVQATAAGAAPPARFLTASGGSWAATDVLASMAHVWVSTKFDEKVWPQGHPQLRFVLKGLKAYDPRKDAALGYVGADAQTWDDPSTHTWTRNAALLRYAFTRGIYAVGHQGEAAYLLMGRGLSAEEAPPERIIAAANLCDEDVDGAARYTANGVISAADDFIFVEEMFAAAMAGVIVQREGGVEVEPGQAKTAVATITDGDLVGGEAVTFSEFLPDGEDGRINTVVPRYVEPAQNWSDHAGPVRRSLDDIAEDGGPREITLPLMLVTDGAQANRCAEITRLLSRLERRASIVLPPEYARLEEGDWIAWTSARRHGGATVRYRIESWTLDEKWRMHLALREISATAYGETEGELDSSDPAAPVAVPADLSLDGVNATAVSLTGSDSASPAIRFVWDTPIDDGVRAIRAEIRPVGSTEVAVSRTEDVAAGVLIVTAGVTGAADLEARLVPIGDPSRAAVASSWIPVTSAALVAGDTAPITPATVAGTPTLAITTTISPDGTQTSRAYGAWGAAADAASYVVEFDDGTITWQEPAAENAIDEKIVVTGPSYRYRVKALSRTGTLSEDWSAWSASVAAGGDSTAPGPVTSPVVTPLARRNVVSWVKPVDDDFDHVDLYRNTTGVAPVSGDFLAEVKGSVYPDTNVTAEVVYYYWAVTVDRTGNEGGFTYLGLGMPTFVARGPDIKTNDPDLVTQYGVASAITGQGGLATKNQAHFFNDTTGRPTVMQDGYFDAGGFFYADGVRNGGVQLNVRWPEENGANKTETRTAAAIVGQGEWATSAIPTAHLTAPGSNLQFNGGFTLGRQGITLAAGTQGGVGIDSYSGRYYSVAPTSVEDMAPFPCQAGTTLTLSAEFYEHLDDIIAYVMFFSGGNGDGTYLGEGGYISGTNWQRIASNPITAPAGTNSAVVRLYRSTNNGGYALIRKVKVEVGSVATPWNDDATNGAVYRDGVTIDGLKPQEPGANVTEGRTAAAIMEQGALATKNQAHFFNDTTGRPTVMQDGYFDAGGFLYADGVRSGGVQLNTRWPEENGANKTEGRTAAAIVAQGELATQDYAVTGDTIRDSGGVLITENRLINDQGVSAGVKAGGVKQFSNGQTAPSGAQPLTVELADGEVHTFDTPYVTPPVVVPSYEGLDALTVAGQYYLTNPVSLSGSGMTGRARKVTPGSGATYTDHSDDGASWTVDTSLYQWAERQKATSGVAHDENYVATVNLETSGTVVGYEPGAPPEPIWGAVTITVGFYGRATAGGAWTLLGTGTADSGETDPAVSLSARQVVITGNVNWTTWNVHGDSEYRVAIISGGGTGGTSGIRRFKTTDPFPSVTWRQQTGGSAPSDVTALSGGRKIKYLVTPRDG